MTVEWRRRFGLRFVLSFGLLVHELRLTGWRLSRDWVAFTLRVGWLRLGSLHLSCGWLVSLCLGWLSLGSDWVAVWLRFGRG